MKKEILLLRTQGKTYNEIVKIVGCSKSTVSYHCGKGQKEKNTKRCKNRRRKNREWLEEFKKTLSCSNCTESRWWVLDFHHRNSNTKEKGVNELIKSASKERVLKEIEKCDILCSNCHRDLHYYEQNEKNMSTQIQRSSRW